MKKIILILMTVMMVCSVSAKSKWKPYELPSEKDLNARARVLAAKMGYPRDAFLRVSYNYTADPKGWIGLTNILTTEIWLNPNYNLWTPAGVDVTLVHEIIHAYTKTDGKLWVSEMERARKVFPEYSGSFSLDIGKEDYSFWTKHNK